MAYSFISIVLVGYLLTPLQSSPSFVPSLRLADTVMESVVGKCEILDCDKQEDYRLDCLLLDRARITRLGGRRFIFETIG